MDRDAFCVAIFARDFDLDREVCTLLDPCVCQLTGIVRRAAGDESDALDLAEIEIRQERFQLALMGVDELREVGVRGSVVGRGFLLA